MSELKGRKDRSSLGIYVKRLNQRGRWEEASCQDRNGKNLNFLVLLDSAPGILGYSGVDSLVSSEVTGTQEVRL